MKTRRSTRISTQNPATANVGPLAATQNPTGPNVGPPDGQNPTGLNG